MHTIDFEPVGRRGKCPDGESLLECGRRLNVDIVSICGGMGICHQCRVQVISGPVSRRTPEEEEAFSEQERGRNCRLACRTWPQGDVKVHIPPESLSAPQRTQVEGLEVEIEPEPLVRGLEVRLTPPTLEEPTADEQNLKRALEEQHGVRAGIVDLGVLQEGFPKIREWGWTLSAALRGNEVVALGAPATRWLGLAVDIGTTKIACYLVDMRTGKTLGSRGLMNPQIAYGEDVIARIYAAGKEPENAEKLQDLLVEALDKALGSLCEETGSVRSEVVDAVIVGNTAIHHLLLRLPVLQLGRSPYVPALRCALDVKARDLGLELAPGAWVHLLPNIAGFCGADHVSMLLATGLAELEGVNLAIDIGTNTEICLNVHGRMASVSCASGPAFEGAHIRHGMRAAPGAIEHVRLSAAGLQIQTIGNQPPIGICGSGLLDVVAQLRLHDILDSSGKMLSHPLVRPLDGSREFVLVERAEEEAITVSQKDVRELQLAKAAIRLGIRALCEAEGLEEGVIGQVLIAGAFGTFIDVESAVAIGMLPPLPLERYRQVGNAAGTGARLALMSRGRRLEAERIAERTRYIELAGIPDFGRKYAEASVMDPR